MIELYSHSSRQIGSDPRRTSPTGDIDLIFETDKPDGMEVPFLSLRGTDTMGIEEVADRSLSSRRGVVWTKNGESRGR